jgi:catechol 2,3-dioxygenase-like lactoylglutathione lyase family enzyme
MIVRANHTSFTVSDLDRSVAFYRDRLGFRVLDVAGRPRDFAERVTGIPAADIRIAYLEAGGHRLELIQYLSHPGARADVRTCNVGSGHLAFDVDDIEGMYRALRAQGVAFASEPLEAPAGTNRGAKVCYFRDPDGITLELIQPPPR